ncbi:hypothetical protein JAAARDRAFT_196771 [Jaapia argillacea MUCL 33604]|uniref:Uncharacterized protein n=1 Tax=Jaapia argillacea MUCL 33604 TaxID=933084 RepID=A0A067PHT2_9AGAM|nr:hypothetical protein JAAARDRAFT_196771 [Jaapia argillacea MUCL 33604]
MDPLPYVPSCIVRQVLILRHSCRVIHLTDFTITSLQGEHSSLLDDTQIFLQLMLDGDVVYETVQGEREADKQVWKVQDCVDIPDLDDIALFSITVMLDNKSRITMELSSIKLTSQGIPAKGQTSKITRDLRGLNVLEFCVNRGSDGPSSPLSPKSLHCEPAIATGTPNTDVHNTQASLSDDGRTSHSPIEGLSSAVLDDIYVSALVEPDVEKKAAKLDELGTMLVMHYQNHHELGSLNRGVSVYEDAVQTAPRSPTI